MNQEEDYERIFCAFRPETYAYLIDGYDDDDDDDDKNKIIKKKPKEQKRV